VYSTMNNQPSATRSVKSVKPKVLLISLLLLLLGWCTWFTEAIDSSKNKSVESVKPKVLLISLALFLLVSFVPLCTTAPEIDNKRNKKLELMKPKVLAISYFGCCLYLSATETENK